MTFDTRALNVAPPTLWPNNAWPVTPGYIGAVTAGPDHIDGFKHVNNMVYPMWAMEAAWHHSDLLGFPFSKFEEIGIGFVISTHQFEYKAPVLEGQTVHIATWIGANDQRLRLTRMFEIRLADSGKLVFRGQTLFISIDMVSGKPVRMPDEFAKAYRVAV